MELEKEENSLHLTDSSYINGYSHTVLTDKEKVALACLLALGGLCSSICMPIYWTALPELARDFNTTQSKINYTVTAYLCFQAVSPIFISSLSDVWGRRPTMIICLIGGIAVNIATACTKSYGVLIFLRCLLATFLASLVSITAAAVGDFTTRKNRGGLSSITYGFTLIGQGIAPFLGSVVDTAWEWPAIFWFSAALDAFVLILLFVLCPETNRVFVGNMSVIPKSWIHRSPILYYFKGRIVPYDENLLKTFGAQTEIYNPWKALALIKKIPVLIILLPCAIQFAAWTISQTSMSIHLQENYHYSALHVGICFFSPGFATVVGTLTAGQILDISYSKFKEKYNNNDQNLNKPFNYIKARIMLIPIFSIVMIGSIIAFGWCLQNQIHLAVILIFSFLLTFAAMYPLSVVGTLLVDMYPTMSGGATALNNLFRCGVSAIFVSCLDYMENKLTIGGTYTLMGAIIAISTISTVWLIIISGRIIEHDY